MNTTRVSYTENVQDGAAAKKIPSPRPPLLQFWLDRRIAKLGGFPVLEVGAHTLNHLRYESMEGAYDITGMSHDLPGGDPSRFQVRDSWENFPDVPHRAEYARVICVTELFHTPDLEGTIARAGLAIRPSGVFQAGIPGRAFSLFANRSRNTSLDIAAAVHYFFADVTIRRFPLPFHKLSAYGYIEARLPRLERCRAHFDRG